MDVIEAIHSRRSIRSFQARSVERALIEAVIHDATQAPPPTRDQVPWTFNVIEGAELIAAYGEEAMAYAVANHPDGPGWTWLERPGFKVFWNATALVIISGPVEDCCRAGQNLMLSALARGLGTCWVGAPMLWLSTEAARAKLQIPRVNAGGGDLPRLCGRCATRAAARATDCHLAALKGVIRPS